MPKIDPYTLPRPKISSATRHFSADSPDYTVTLTLRPATFALAAAAEEEAGRLIETYLTGSEQRGRAPFPHEGIAPSETLFRVVTLLQFMQCPENPADSYDGMELILISDRLPKTWGSIMEWFAEMSASVEELLGKNSPSGPEDF